MEGNSNTEEKQALVDSMRLKIQQIKPPNSHRSSSSCISRAPRKLAEINNKAYKPEIVSIGPYHHGGEGLEDFEKHKWRYLDTHLNRTTRDSLKDCVKAIGSMEERIRESYSEVLDFDSDELVEMMVLDGCFIIEFFYMFHCVVPKDQCNSTFTDQWMIPVLMRDLIKLENQIPFFVLETLILCSSEQKGKTAFNLRYLFWDFFKPLFRCPFNIAQRYSQRDVLHLLDFLRSCFVPYSENVSENVFNSIPKKNHCAADLYQRGIKFKGIKVGIILDMKFKKGVIEIPSVTIDDFTSCFFMNCIAYEQCHGGLYMQSYFNNYAALLDTLVNTTKGVRLLRDSNVFEHYYGTDEEAAKFCNDLGKDLVIDLGMNNLSKLYEEINEYCEDISNVQWASFKQTYFDTPWSFLSAVAAVILLLLTTAQTFFSVFGYFRPPSK